MHISFWLLMMKGTSGPHMVTFAGECGCREYQGSFLRETNLFPPHYFMNAKHFHATGTWLCFIWVYEFGKWLEGRAFFLLVNSGAFWNKARTTIYAMNSQIFWRKFGYLLPLHFLVLPSSSLFGNFLRYQFFFFTSFDWWKLLCELGSRSALTELPSRIASPSPNENNVRL